ncbi:MAG: type I-E CRISPR-associated protein Cas6/Cse3/CasE [Desulfovibrio sp.]|nr:type I-E CRISPR-associated protein Cas6/Cse3/CasE [Desulfovibrio sp.]
MRWLTQYRLSPAETHSLRLIDVYSLHRIVYDLFEDVRQGRRDSSSGILFADKGSRRGVRTILILSDRLPRIPEYGDLQSRKVTECYLQADSYSFEVIINPVRRDNASRKLVPIRGRDAVAQWFSSKAPHWGFEADETSLQVKTLDVQSFSKKVYEVTIAMATITGILRVKDRQSFVRSFCQGLGRAKAFGCGLLQIIP